MDALYTKSAGEGYEGRGKRSRGRWCRNFRRIDARIARKSASKGRVKGGRTPKVLGVDQTLGRVYDWS